MGCRYCTSPGPSLFTWAATSVWRRAPWSKPPFTSMWKVHGCKRVLLGDDMFEIMWWEREERSLQSEAEKMFWHFSPWWQGAVCVWVFFAEEGVCDFDLDRYKATAIYWVHEFYCICFSVWLHILLAHCHLCRLKSCADHDPQSTHLFTFEATLPAFLDERLTWSITLSQLTNLCTETLNLIK